MPTDKERLDWIQRHEAVLDASCCWSEVSPIVVVQTGGGESGYGRNVRTAIDRAIRASKPRWAAMKK